MDYLYIALIVLVLFGVWAVVEVALTMRSARKSIDKITTSASEVIEQAQPIVAKLDGVVDELEPAAKEAVPLLKKAEVSLDSANVSLERVNGILEDVSSVSGTASTVTGAVNRAAETAVSGVASVVSRLKGGVSGERVARLEGADAAEPAHDEPAPQRYVEYVSVGAQADEPTDADAEENVTLSVPAEADFARSVRMTASTLAVCCDMSVEDVEDVRMIAEEGFVYSCATAPERVGVSFSLTGDAMTMDFTLGDAEPADESIELVEVLLSAVCDVFSVSEDGRVLHLVKRAGDAHDD